MPIIKSAQKALRQSKKKKVQNISTKKAYKGAIKKISKFITCLKLYNYEHINWYWSINNRSYNNTYYYVNEQ